jgi:hypothetical protein
MANPHANVNADRDPQGRPDPTDVHASLTRLPQLLTKDLPRKKGGPVIALGDSAKLFSAAVDAGDGDAIDLLMESPGPLLLSLVVALIVRVQALEAVNGNQTAQIVALSGRVNALERH